MFLEASRYQSYVSGPFLILFSKTPGKEVRALVRHVSLRQSGHFMVGRAHAALMHHRKPSTEFTIPLSGTFGADGLTRDPDEIVTEGYNIWDYLLQLPDDLTRKFWKDESGYGAQLHEWAVANRDNLRPLKRRRYCAECSKPCNEFFRTTADLWKSIYGKDSPAVHTECLNKRMISQIGRGLCLADFIDDGVLSFVHKLGSIKGEGDTQC